MDESGRALRQQGRRGPPAGHDRSGAARGHRDSEGSPLLRQRRAGFDPRLRHRDPARFPVRGRDRRVRRRAGAASLCTFTTWIDTARDTSPVWWYNRPSRDSSYIEVDGEFLSGPSTRYGILVTLAPTWYGVVSEGSVAAPVEVAAGAPFIGTVATRGTSYYRVSGLADGVPHSISLVGQYEEPCCTSTPRARSRSRTTVRCEPCARSNAASPGAPPAGSASSAAR